MPIKGYELADLLTTYAKAYRKKIPPDNVVRNKHMNDYRGDPPSQELVDAIVVDFINFSMGFGCGMDMALNTSDIQSEGPPED